MINHKPELTTVMLLAAGHGERMLPLTETTPKPLLKVGNRSLIEHHLFRLKDAGFQKVVINLAHLGDQIKQTLGNGKKYSLEITYSDETHSGALETAGGIQKALPLIPSDSFLVINADIWTDFAFDSLLSPLKNLGRLVMVDNPEHNPTGDFAIDNDNLLVSKDSLPANSLTFSGIALYQRQLFSQLAPGRQPLAPIFNKLINNKQLEGFYHQGVWHDVGTPQRLKELNRRC